MLTAYCLADFVTIAKAAIRIDRLAFAFPVTGQVWDFQKVADDGPTPRMAVEHPIKYRKYCTGSDQG